MEQDPTTGVTRVVRAGARGRLLPIRERLTARMEQLVRERHVRAHPDLLECSIEQVEYWLRLLGKDVTVKGETELAKRERAVRRV